VLPLVGGGRKAEGTGDEVDVDVRALRGKLGEERFEELLVPLAGRKAGH
jgi:hypothetical protein